MKKHVIKYTVIILLLSMTVWILSSCTRQLSFIQDEIETIAISHNGSFYTTVNDEPKETFLKGVNMGATVPGYFPGHLAISKETYLRWFEMIDDMHANTIRVYTTMTPDFYEALYTFNDGKDEPLYILQGVWINEENIKNIADAYGEDGTIINELIQDTKDLIDIFHGNKTLETRPGFAAGTYTVDVSEYIVGWILGIEWSPDFVIGTNEKNPDKTQFNGTYLHTKNASPFEVFLAEVGDEILAYEVDNYQMTRPLSFTNWLTTDLLSHPNEPDEDEDQVSVNPEHIIATKKAFAGMFASYHIYPYYPEFMNYEPAYQDWIDPDTGNKNAYKAYLSDLIDHHDMPVLVAEFGIPSSRGQTHLNPDGFNQGGHNEQDQAALIKDLLDAIIETNAMGALIFSWQDEWFKRTWNTMDFDLSWRRPFWSNAETNEQSFGILTFDPQSKETLHQTDGDLTDWQGINPISQINTTTLYADSDERYLYLLISDPHINFTDETLYIPIDTIPNQGNTTWDNQHVSFNVAADFVILIHGDHTGLMMVDSYYDANQYLYANVLEMIPSSQSSIPINSGQFSSIEHVLSASFTLPLTGEIIPFSSYNAGLLHYGNSNPDADNYDSLSDYYVGDDFVEIRIPWLLLNVMDPSTKQIISDFNVDNFEFDGFTSETTSGFQFSLTYYDQNHWVTLPSALYDWEAWHTVTYHERLKPAYDVIKDVFLDIT